MVGAPFYYTKSEGGAVYLYLNSKGRFTEVSTRLTGKPESRFGFALANAGDLNKVSSPIMMHVLNASSTSITT